MSEEEKQDIEEEIVVETPEEEEKQEQVQEEPEKQAVSEKKEEPENEDELATYTKSVQKRIKKLTEKYRHEERDKDEAVRLSQQLREENEQLKSRIKQLDNGYLNQYGAKLTHQEEAAKRAYKEAYESGDSERMFEAQQQISQVEVERQKYTAAKARAEQQKVQVQQPEPPAQTQQPVAQRVDPRAQSWAEKNEWFGEDMVMTAASFAIDKQLREEGFDPSSDEYYSEVDGRMRKEFPHKFQTAKKSGGAQVAAAAAQHPAVQQNQGAGRSS
tara:strand:+ start:237 stop:1052 length:816 start_codon:yes stop_codon:yes gene_type:complete